MSKYIPAFFLALSFFSSCGDPESKPISDIENTQKVVIKTPEFNSDSAYSFIAKQVDFGPRVPLTTAHTECGNWLVTKLNEFCDTVYLQQTTVIAGNKKEFPCKNIIGSINPNAKRRILLLAHWDTRPWADQENPPSDQPILGADDGASGVGVLIELARIVQGNPFPNKDLGIDILFVDMEDYGKNEWGENSYALGAQHWANDPHLANYNAEAGILLDMVGAKNARFPHEGFSKSYAGYVLKQVWAAAADIGYSSYFVNDLGGTITDDHVPINQIRKIPTIDIINLPSGSRTGFVPHWHTHGDNMDVIDKNTLKAVGQTLLQYLYGIE